MEKISIDTISAQSGGHNTENVSNNDSAMEKTKRASVELKKMKRVSYDEHNSSSMYRRRNSSSSDDDYQIGNDERRDIKLYQELEEVDSENPELDKLEPIIRKMQHQKVCFTELALDSEEDKIARILTFATSRAASYEQNLQTALNKGKIEGVKRYKCRNNIKSVKLSLKLLDNYCDNDKNYEKISIKQRKVIGTANSNLEKIEEIAEEHNLQ